VPDSVTPRPPLVYLADESPLVRERVAHGLVAAGVQVYMPGAAGDPANPTTLMGAFACAVMDLERHHGSDDAVDTAELLLVYQPDLPLAFFHQNATPLMLHRARSLGPIFRKPDELAHALAWIRERALS
jgi:hypothetical protein